MTVKKISQQTAILSLYSGLFSTVGQHANISVINTVSGDFIPASNLGV
jgi:hypothetical protein